MNYTTVLEDDHLASRSRRSTEGPSPFFHAIKGAKMVVVSEMEKQLDVAKIKKLCDPMGVPQATRALYNMPEQWRPSCTVGIGSNVPPDVSGQNTKTIKAFQRRLALIPFPM
jgi:phage/plasmid-associated DNA primase